jgi:hypothetical protein
MRPIQIIRAVKTVGQVTTTEMSVLRLELGRREAGLTDDLDCIAQHDVYRYCLSTNYVYMDVITA